MQLNPQLAKHLREIHFGGNWSASNLKDTLSDISLNEALTKIGNLNSIAALTFHMNYYVAAILKVFEGGPLDAKDKYSFDLPPLRTNEEWEEMLNKSWRDAETLAILIEKMPEEKNIETFVDEKYGNYLRNIIGVIEHLHYHLGQVVFLKKLLRETPDLNKL
jgi:uncharacterized damage-inducible protein DinB